MKTVAIVGSHHSTRHLAPYNDETKEIWVCNGTVLRDWVTRCDVMFEIHPPGNYTTSDQNYWKWLQENQKARIVMNEVDPRIPKSEAYPLKEICQKYLRRFKRGQVPIHYFSTTIAYQIALALYEGATHIEIWGVELEVGTEYVYQRDSVGLWVGIALGLGCHVTIPDGCILFDAPLYGYEDDVSILDRKEFEEAVTFYQHEVEQRRRTMDIADGKVRGVLQQVEQARAAGDTPAEMFKRLSQHYDVAMREFTTSILNFGLMQGRLDHCQQCLNVLDARLVSAGHGQEVMAMKMPKAIYEQKKRLANVPKP